MSDGGLTIADVGAMTFPQLICRFSENPPETGRRVNSFEAYEAAVREQEAAWSSPA